VYLLLGVGLIDDLEDRGANLCADVRELSVGFEGLDDQIFEFVEFLHNYRLFKSGVVQIRPIQVLLLAPLMVRIGIVRSGWV
jgi:hypothetical protein